MYKQKRFFMMDDASHNYVTAPERRWALDKGEIFVEYQPTLSRSADNGWEMGGVEAVPRWQHPKRGVLQPATFAPALEKSGLLAPLSDFVLVESVRQIAAWQQHGLDITMTANSPPALLSDPTFSDRLVALLDCYHLDYAKLSLEISEDCVVNGPVGVMESLGRLRGNGFGLVVSGFSTGCSSLSQLYQRLACNELRIDAALVQKIRESSVARATINAIIFLAHKLGISVCADGVETEYAFSFLTDAGCDKLQGLLIGPAIPAAKLQDRMREWCSVNQTGAGGQGSVSI